MKPKLTTKVPGILAVLMFTSVASHAAISFTENFSDFSPNPNMVLGTPADGVTTASFTSGAFAISSTNVNGRIYLGTTAANYSTVNFVFEADVYVPHGFGWGIAFFGMGNTIPNPDYYNEPSSVNVGMAVRNDFNRLEFMDNGSGWFPPTISDAGVTVPATHGLRMSWNAEFSLATFEFDSGNDGIYEHSYTVDGSNNGFTASNSQLFIGGGEGLTFDNVTVTVIPEPGASLLGGLGVLLLLRRRRN